MSLSLEVTGHSMASRGEGGGVGGAGWHKLSHKLSSLAPPHPLQTPLAPASRTSPVFLRAA